MGETSIDTLGTKSTLRTAPTEHEAPVPAATIDPGSPAACAAVRAEAHELARREQGDGHLFAQGGIGDRVFPFPLDNGVLPLANALLDARQTDRAGRTPRVYTTASAERANPGV